VCMYFSKTSGSTSFVWRTIEMELNRLSMEVSVCALLLNSPTSNCQLVKGSSRLLSILTPLTNH
jgi:hypothetical protein